MLLVMLILLRFDKLFLFNKMIQSLLLLKEIINFILIEFVS